MMGVVQGATEGDAKQALDILGTVSSEKKYQERLKELIDKAEEIKHAQANLDQATGTSAKVLAAAEQMRSSMIAEGQAAKNEAARIKAEATALLSEAKRQEKLLADRTAAEDSRLEELGAVLHKRKSVLDMEEKRHAENTRIGMEQLRARKKQLLDVVKNLQTIQQNLGIVNRLEQELSRGS